MGKDIKVIHISHIKMLCHFPFFDPRCRVVFFLFCFFSFFLFWISLFTFFFFGFFFGKILKYASLLFLFI